MSSNTPAVKRQNHRLYHCTQQRKNELLAFLARHHAGKKILVVTSETSEEVNLPEGALLMSDEELAAAPAQTLCDVLISYDLPEKALVYMGRLARTSEFAFIMLGEADQKHLYPIETLLGRAITQESTPGFAPAAVAAVEAKDKKVRERREARAANPGERQQSDGKRRDGAPRGKKPSRFVGKDENGKAIFSGKTGERNHRYDGTPREEGDSSGRKPRPKEEKFAKSGKKPFAKSDKKPFSKEGKKPFAKNGKRPDADRKYDGAKQPAADDKRGNDAEKKPYGDKPKSGPSKKPYGKKPFDKKNSDKKPFDKKPYDKKRSDGKKNERRDAAASAPKAAEPKRPPRRIKVKSLKPAEKSE